VLAKYSIQLILRMCSRFVVQRMACDENPSLQALICNMGNSLAESLVKVDKNSLESPRDPHVMIKQWFAGIRLQACRVLRDAYWIIFKVVTADC
jgi:hypothetical protein